MRSNQKPIAVSMGEPAGIGPDLALIAWANRKALGLPPFYIRGDEALLHERAQKMGLNARLRLVAPLNKGIRSRPSNCGNALVDPPAACTKVGKKSMVVTGVSHFVPPWITPGQLTTIGTLSPPSCREPFLSASHSVGKWPPLSE